MRLLEDDMFGIPLHQKVAQPAGAMAHQPGIENRVAPIIIGFVIVA